MLGIIIMGSQEIQAAVTCHDKYPWPSKQASDHRTCNSPIFFFFFFLALTLKCTYGPCFPHEHVRTPFENYTAYLSGSLFTTKPSSSSLSSLPATGALTDSEREQHVQHRSLGDPQKEAKEYRSFGGGGRGRTSA